MPPRQRRRRTDRHTNVFVQENSPKGREEIEDFGDDDDVAIGTEVEGGSEPVVSTQAVSASRARRLRSQRVARQTRVRSDIFTRSIGKELRKLGVLGAGIAAILVALTFTL